MDAVRSWLDADDVRRLAERLLIPRGEVLLPSPETPFGRGFEGFAEGPVTAADPLTPAPPAAPPPGDRSEGDAAPLAAAAGGVAPPASPEPPRGPFLQRLRRFREWLCGQFGVRGMFLLDRDGAVIFDDGANERLHALARNLAAASRAASGAGSNIHVKIGADATLEVIPADTHYGLLILGAVVPQGVPPRGVALIVDALRRTVMPPGR